MPYWAFRDCMSITIVLDSPEPQRKIQIDDAPVNHTVPYGYNAQYRHFVDKHSPNTSIEYL